MLDCSPTVKKIRGKLTVFKPIFHSFYMVILLDICDSFIINCFLVVGQYWQVVYKAKILRTNQSLFQQSKIIWVPWSMLSLVNFNKKCKWIMTHGSIACGLGFLNHLYIILKCLNWILIFSYAWHWLLSVGNISIRALGHNPPSSS